MFDIGFGLEKLVLLGVLALLVVGPKDLPRLLYIAGKWLGKAQRMANEFKQSIATVAHAEELRQAQQDLVKLQQQMHESVSLPTDDFVPPRAVPPHTTSSQPLPPHS